MKLFSGVLMMLSVCAFVLCALGVCAFAQDAAKPAPAAPPAQAAAPAAQTPDIPDTVIATELTPELLKNLEEYWTSVESPETATQNVTSLDVRQCVRMALQNNPAGKIAQADVNAARARVGQARSQLFPHATIDEALIHLEPEGTNLLSSLGSLTGSSLTAPILIIGGLLQPGGPDIANVAQGALQLLMTPKMETPGNDSRRDHLQITQTLYAGGQIRAGIKASRYLAESQEWRKQARLDQLEFDAKKAYYDVLLTRALVRVAEESVKTFERHLADTQQMLDVGLVSNFEVLRAKTEVGSRQADRVSARNGERLALVNLRRIIGLPQDAPAYLEGKTGLELTNETIEQLLPTAAQERPELKTLDKAILAAQQGVRRAKGEYYPRAAATIDYTHMDGGVASMMSSQGWTFTVAGQWDLYAGGKRKHDVAEQKATLSGLEYQRIDVAQLVELDVRSAFIQMQDALAKVGEQKGTVDLAREGKRLADLRYQEGVSTQVETLDADLALTRAETALVMALHDYAVALASLDKAVSRSWVARDTEDQPACKEAAK